MRSRQRILLIRYLPLLLIGAVLTLLLYTQPIANISDQRGFPKANDGLNNHGNSNLNNGRQQRPMGGMRTTVKEPIVTAEDSDMQVLSKTHDIAIPVPVAPWSESDMALLKTAFGQSVQSELFTKSQKTPDFRIMTYQQRIFKALFQYFDPIITQRKVNVKTDSRYKDSWDVYERLEKILYPWINPHWNHIFDINEQSKGRGIVMCVGNHHFQYAATAIRSLREALNCTLPIEVFYIYDDLSEDRRRYFETEFADVKTRRVVDFFDNSYTMFGGWSLKPYAILASSFREVMLVDADAYFFKNPVTLFDDAGYKKTGALFFYDRTLFAGWTTGRQWLSSFLPTKSQLVENTRWWRLTSAHEQESGVVVINKELSLLGLLATCKMNDKAERDLVTYKNIHGDKETFWIGFEMMQTPYAFIKSYGAVIGGLGDAGPANTVCGNQLHLDVDGRPFWWNGGLLRDKNKWADRYLTFTHYAEGEDWDFENSCIKETDKIRSFTSEERALALAFVEMDKKRRIDEELIEQGQWTPHSRAS